jgi:hypothetical protein
MFVPVANWCTCHNTRKKRILDQQTLTQVRDDAINRGCPTGSPNVLGSAWSIRADASIEEEITWGPVVSRGNGLIAADC